MQKTNVNEPKTNDLKKQSTQLHLKEPEHRFEVLKKCLDTSFPETAVQNIQHQSTVYPKDNAVKKLHINLSPHW